MGEMMTQGSSYSIVPARRTMWLRAMLPLLQACTISPRKVVATSGAPTLGTCQNEVKPPGA